MGHLGIARHVFNTEIQALNQVCMNLDLNFDIAVELINNCSGKIIILGVGKSGQIGEKIASTLASIQVPALFVNPLDAYHGSLGILKTNDLVIIISNSGETEEILRLIPYLLSLGIKIISLTGNVNSSLAQTSTAILNTAIEKEADTLSIIPTSSTTVALVMGDALAVAIMNLRKFSKTDFLLSHPGGALGKLK